MSDPIVTYLQQHLDEYVADLGHLSAIDSGTDDKAGVDAVQDWLTERMQRQVMNAARRSLELLNLALLTSSRIAAEGGGTAAAAQPA